ncbi:MAG: hypothetical protein NTV65_11115 [Proteobacteria bacterium]|nr:hypothetical protein [Pseudomonadota bacterium]
MTCKKMRPCKQKHPLLLLMGLVACTLLVPLVGFFSSNSLASEAPDTAVVVACGASTGITLPLSDSWQQVPMQQPDILCAFRSKIAGFPTINVVQEPAYGATFRPGIPARERRIQNSYHLVGLTDATLNDSHLEPLGTLETFRTKITYKNQGQLMEALLLEAELPDRTYTVTILDLAGSPTTSKARMEAILRGITIAGATDLALNSAIANRPTYLAKILVLSIFMLILLAVFGTRGRLGGGR